MKFTFYLFNETVNNFDAAIRESKLEGEDAFEEIDFKVELPFDAKAYFQQNKQTRPKWLNYVKEYLNIDENKVVNTTNSLLLLIKLNNRIFGITQGFGSTAIDRSNIERGFGLKVVLNEIDPEKIKTVDARKIDTTTKQKRVFINHNSPLYEFEFDVDQDLINSLAGYPINTELAKKLSGSDSLGFTGDVDFIELGNKCADLLESFKKENYKESFGFIDYLKVIKDGGLIEQLNEKLLHALYNAPNEKMLLAYPEIMDFNQIHQFKISLGYIHEHIDEITIESVREFLSGNSITDINPSKISIIGVDQDDHFCTKKFALDEFVVFETLVNDTRYLYSLKQWFELNENYVTEVEESVASINLIRDANYLPSMERNQREDAYNALAAGNDPRYLLLDKRNIRLEGFSQIEVCDLLSVTNEFICVKKYNGSSTLSHLFSQGYVSSTLLNDYPDYREFIVNKCPNNFDGLAFSRDALHKEDITFVFAIACSPDKELIETLPFFSKVTLRNARKSIERMGFKVKLYKIPYRD